MDVAGLLIESFGRVDGVLTRAVDGLSVDELAFRPDPQANSIAWLAWHAARGEDAQIADVAGTEQVWTSQGWADRFDLPFDDSATGYGHSAQDVGRVRASSDLLVAYPGRCATARWTTCAVWRTATSTGWSTTAGTRR